VASVDEYPVVSCFLICWSREFFYFCHELLPTYLRWAKLLWILFFTDCRNSKRLAQQTPHAVVEGTVMRLHAL